MKNYKEMWNKLRVYIENEQNVLLLKMLEEEVDDKIDLLQDIKDLMEVMEN